MEFRPKARDGLWLCFLLPIAMMLTYSNVSIHQTSDLTGTLLAFVLSIHSTYFALSAPLPSLQESRIRKSLLTYSKHNFPLIVTMTVIILIMILTTLGVFEFLLCSVCFMIFRRMLPKLFPAFKQSFSYGEGCLVLQSLLVFSAKTFLSFIHDEHNPSTVEGSFNIIANVGLVSLLFLCSVSYIPMFSFINNSSTFYLTGSSMIFGISLPYLWIRLMRNPVAWIVDYIWSTKHLVFLFVFWFLCTVSALILVLRPRSLKASTAYRKFFHALVVIVFTSGVLVDVNFLYLSSIAGICLMVLLEHMRFKNIEPVANILNSTFQMFKDDKDQGDLVLTNIYLLAGVSLPLWLSASLMKDNPVTLLSGVLSIGIGDAFASIIGSKIGRYRLMNSEKTLEGLVASILSQIAFIKLLEVFNLILVEQKIAVILAIMIVSITEVITTQVDNIALPFLMYSLMRLFVK